MQQICAGCGERMDKGHGAYCDTCKPATDHKARQAQRQALDGRTTAERGYGWNWQKLSARARRLQPFCLDCGAEHDLTTDHTMRAWRRVAEGKAIRLKDIDVVCRRCNSERGAARGEKASDKFRQTQGE